MAEALPQNVDWAFFGDALASLLKQAYMLKLVDEQSLETIRGNLSAGRFTKEHYAKLYGKALQRFHRTQLYATTRLHERVGGRTGRPHTWRERKKSPQKSLISERKNSDRSKHCRRRKNRLFLYVDIFLYR